MPRLEPPGWVPMRAHVLLGLPAGVRIRVATQHKHGQEYEAVLVHAEQQPTAPREWIRITHRRPELGRDTINVVPPTTPVFAWMRPHEAARHV